MTATATTGSGAPKKAINMGAAVTRSFLGYGVLVGPFYLLVGVVQGLVRDGFSFARHPLSVLANGAGGWVQTVNFVLSGLMVIAAAVGFWRVPAPRLRASPAFLALFGLSMIVAAVLRADPVDGFPAGTPLGAPTVISPMGMGHFIAGTIGFVSLELCCLCSVRGMSRNGYPSLALGGVVSGLTVLVGFFGGFVIPGIAGTTIGIWIAVVVGWVWLGWVSARLYRMAPSPEC